MQTAESEQIIELQPKLDLEAAPALLASVQTAIASQARVTLDASRVEELSFPCLQILLAALRAAPSAQIGNPGDGVVEAFSVLGLADHLDMARIEIPRSDPQEAEQEASADPAVTRILTIDDSKTMRDMLMLTLSSSGYDVVQAVDGCDGLKKLESEQVDIIITDINMPNMDGYGVIEHVRADASYNSTPILVLTTESDREKKERARDLGATGFIVKPFNPAKLVDVIRKVSP